MNDIAYLEKTLPRVHKNLFFHLPEEEFHRQLAEIKDKVPAYTDEQIEIELSVILAGIGDTHTGSSISANTGTRWSFIGLPKASILPARLKNMRNCWTPESSP